MDFEGLRNKAEDLAEEHAEQIDSGLEKAGEFAKNKFGHEEQIDQAVDKVKDFLPGGE